VGRLADAQLVGVRWRTRGAASGTSTAIAQPAARIEDVSRLLGHSTVRVTQDIYVSPDGDLYDRFYPATG
jgi:hypothetical protein